MPRLIDLEVDEVSLVDRPATGRKFRIVKRDARFGFLNRWRGEASEEGEAVPAPEEMPPATLPDLETVWKRLEETLGFVAKGLDELAEQSRETRERLERLEAPPATRQSLDGPSEGAPSVWKGVL